MAKPRGASPPRDWWAIKQAYEESDLTLREISLQFKVAQPAIYDRIAAEGWKMRRPHARKSVPKSAGERMLMRLSKAVAKRLDELEDAGLTSAQSVADRERDTRSLGALVKLSEKIVQLEKSARERASGPVEWTQEYRDRKREELAQRVIRMLEQIRGEPLPDGP